MTWKQWSLKEWNEALVREVFLTHERIETTISRIDASGRFLAKCTKDQLCNPEEARQIFINAFGTTATSVRAKFRWYDISKATYSPDKTPSCFAALYLTLLAASADNETAGVGDFRNRFSEIVKATHGLSVDFGSLPLMWTAVQEWTAVRHNIIGDCALLVLPNPKREKLIGYSKRIAFPAYKDEIFLRKTLQKFNLSENSPFTDVALAVAREISKANTLENFKDEFREFNRLVARAENQMAYESPFWGAVRDICFEQAQEQAKNKGIASLSIDIADPADPQLNFYMDEIAAKRIDIPIKELSFARRDGCKFIAFKDGHQLSLDTLQVLASNRKTFRDSKIGKSISEGWLIFLPDQIGELTTNGSFYGGGSICVVAKNSELVRLIQLIDSLGVKAIKLNSYGMLDGWLGLHIQSVSEQFFTRLQSYMPASMQVMLHKGWAPPRPRLSGGSWYGQMLLLNPASNPIVRMQGAVKGEYRLMSINSDEVKRGDLIVLEDGFQIPSIDLTAVSSNVHVCEFILATAEEKKSTLKTHLIADPPEGQPAQLRDRMQWLIDSPSGVLCRLGEEHGIIRLKKAISNQKHLPSNLFPPSLVVDSNSYRYESTNSDFNVVTPALNWLIDALSLRFERRSSLTFDLLDEHLAGAAEAGGLNARDLRKLLFCGQWLRTQTQRSAPHSSVSRAELEIYLTSRNGELIARVVGMLSRQSAAKLMKALQPRETCSRISTSNPLSIGCIEIKVSSKERVVQISQEIGAQIVSPHSDTVPLAALIPSSSEIQIFESPVECQQAEKWNWGWSSAEGSQTLWTKGELRRAINGPKAWYWIKLAEEQFLKTDSISWAWMASCIANGKNIARQDKEGAIVWDKSIISLPASLTRWWMLFGGGCIALTEDGHILFTGYDCPKAIEVMGWKSNLLKDPRISTALSRRKLALSLKKAHIANFHNVNC